MNSLPFFLGFIAIAGSVALLLYRGGYFATKSLTAVLFVFQPSQNGDTVTLNSCNGWTRHVMKFQESRTYELTLETQLTKGDVAVLLLDKEKRPMLRLTGQTPTGRIELDSRNRYYLRWEFQNATGKCALRW